MFEVQGNLNFHTGFRGWRERLEYQSKHFRQVQLNVIKAFGMEKDTGEKLSQGGEVVYKCFRAVGLRTWIKGTVRGLDFFYLPNCLSQCMEVASVKK